MFMERHDTVKMLGLPNLIYKFNVIPIKISVNHFVDINKLTLKFIQRGKTENRTTNTILKDKNKVGRLTLPNFKTHNKSILIKTVWYWGKNK